jgi:hypothetical protein
VSIPQAELDSDLFYRHLSLGVLIVKLEHRIDPVFEFFALVQMSYYLIGYICCHFTFPFVMYYGLRR